MNHSHFCCHFEKNIGIQMHVFTGAISSKLKYELLDKFIWLECSQWGGWIIFLMFQTQRWLHTYPLYLHHKSWKQFLAQLHLSFFVLLIAWFPCVDHCSLTAYSNGLQSWPLPIKHSSVVLCVFSINGPFPSQVLLDPRNVPCQMLGTGSVIKFWLTRTLVIINHTK